MVKDLGRSAVALPGPWRFHLGDYAEWASPAIDDSRWEEVTADKAWDDQGHWGYDGFAWYRLPIEIAAGQPAPGSAGVPQAGPIRPQGASSPASNLCLFIPSVGDSYEVYWNGNLRGRSGLMPPQPKWYGDSSAVVALGPAQDGVIAIRVWRAPYLSIAWNDLGGLRAPPSIGYCGEIEAGVKAASDRSFRFDVSYLLLFPLYAIAAVLGLLAWLGDRAKTAYLWMSCFSISMIAMLLGSMPLGWKLTEPLLLTINRAGFGVRDIALWFMLLWLLDLRRVRMLRRTTQVLAELMAAGLIVYVLLLMVAWPSARGAQAQYVERILAGVYALPGFWSLVLAGFALASGKKLGLSRWLLALATVATQLLVVARNVSIVGPQWTHWWLTGKLLTPLAVVDGIAVHQHTVTDTLVLAALVFAFYRDAEESRRRHEHLEQEFQNAREVQKLLIPDALPDVAGYQFTSAYIPALEVGGDFFQIIPCEDRSTLVVVGDVSGKGLKAAMAVSLIVGTVRALVDEGSGPASLLEAVNNRLHGRLQGGFATCLVLRLDPDGRCRVAAAGHPPPWRNDQEIDLPGAFPLGLSFGVVYEELTVELGKGDCLYLFTDGLLEAMRPGGELFGFDRIKLLFATRPTAGQAAQAAVDFGQDDDITVLTLTAQA